MRLFLVRHPRPLIGPQVCYGSSDVAVPENETARAARTLVDTLPRQAELVSSPLRRCADLAQAIAGFSPGMQIEFDPRLVELNFGAWEAREWDAIPRDEIDAWAAAPISWQPGGGESVLQMARRVRDFYEAKKTTSGDCIVVCHAGTIRLLLACCVHRELADIAMAAVENTQRVAYAEVVVVAQT